VAHRYSDSIRLPVPHRHTTCIAALVLATACAVVPKAPTIPRGGPHSLVLFVPDGLRATAVNPETAPALAAVRDQGVDFRNPHSLFPTFTMANAAAMATGHYLGDNGVFSNTIFAGAPIRGAVTTVTPFLEHDVALGDMDAHFGGNFLNEQTILEAARTAGFSTAAVGKLGPTLIFDHTARDGEDTIVLDDATGSPAGIPVSPLIERALSAAGLPLQTPSRGENGRPGTSTTPGAREANVAQQSHLVDAVTRVILPEFKKRGRPFVLVFWSRDPDGSQHNQGDSLNELTPGINGATSLAGLKNADSSFTRIRAALDAEGLTPMTNIVVAADHGFSTISKQSATSEAARASYAGVPDKFLPPGFLAIDLAEALRLPLFDPDSKNARVSRGAFPARGNGLLGVAPDRPAVVVAANGGSDLIYVTDANKALTARIVEILGQQDYVSGLFVDDRVGELPGALPMSALALTGAAVTPRPTIVVGFRSHSTGCQQPLLCSAVVADSTLQQGQGQHGSFSRADSMNFMAATGPGFKRRFVSDLPAGNADVGRTIAALLGLTMRDSGRAVGRVLTESFPGGAVPTAERASMRASAASGSVRTELHYQTVGRTKYFDVAGTPGRAVGLDRDTPAATRSTP
jgi:hypothetical protein